MPGPMPTRTASGIREPGGGSPFVPQFVYDPVLANVERDEVMPQLKPGVRLKSVVCNGEAMVVKAIDVTVTCGGVPMVADGEEADPNAQADPEHMYQCLMGKRYVNEEGTLELLCVKAGEGSFGVDGQMLMGKETKKLPSSD